MTGTNQLPRVLGYVLTTAIVVGTVIGSGVFKKASAVSGNVAETGLALTAWVLVGILTILGALTLAEVAVIVGKAGGGVCDSARRVRPLGRLPVGLGRILDHPLRVDRRPRDHIHRIAARHSADISLHPENPEIDVLSPLMLSAMTATVIAVLALVNVRGTRIGAGTSVDRDDGEGPIADYDRTFALHRLCDGDFA